jgi:hypothetical protein
LEDAEATTPKRKTLLLCSDEKKEEDLVYDFELSGNRDGVPCDLFQPDLTPIRMKEAISSEFIVESDDDGDYVEDTQHLPDLDELDLQLIDLRRPVGAEYGDDERSM